MFRLLVTAPLVAEPMRRVSSTGKTYATFLLRSTESGTTPVLVSCIVFDADSVEEVLTMHRGESLSVSGSGELSSWTGQDGTENHGLKCTVDRIVTLRARE